MSDEEVKPLEVKVVKEKEETKEDDLDYEDIAMSNKEIEEFEEEEIGL